MENLPAKPDSVPFGEGVGSPLLHHRDESLVSVTACSGLPVVVLSLAPPNADQDISNLLVLLSSGISFLDLSRTLGGALIPSRSSWMGNKSAVCVFRDKNSTAPLLTSDWHEHGQRDFLRVSLLSHVPFDFCLA